MAFMVSASSAVVKTPDGLYHVTNIIMGMRGQHHVHTEKGYRAWKKGLEKEWRVSKGNGACNCGQRPGDVEEYDGRKWHNDNF